MTPPVGPTAALVRATNRAPPAPARVVAVHADALLLWADGRLWRQPRGADDRSGDPLRPGDIVAVDGAATRRVGRPSADVDAVFSLDGDLGRLLADGGLRAQALFDRAVMLATLRGYFDRRGFLEVDTPAIARSPGLELHLDPVEVALREGMGGAQVRRHLVTSPEYHCKRLLHAGFTRVYSLAHAYRSGERGAWHNPEFTMLEWYRAGGAADDILRDLHLVARAVARGLAARRRRDGVKRPVRMPGPPLRLAFFDALERFGQLRVADAAGRCLPLPELRASCEAVGVAVRPGDDEASLLLQAFAERVEPALMASPWLEIAPWPASLASLARPLPEAPWLADRFEVYAHGVEIANGFGELVDATEQRRRFTADLAARDARGLPQPPIDERFLQALERGCPPSAGVALGVDRLLMVLGAYDDIEQVLAFPFERA